jgi:flagellar biogenesis protein FliO
MKEAICSSVKVGDDTLVIGILEYLQSDKKIKTLTDTAELIEDAVHAATVEQSSEMLNSILKWNHNNKIKKLNTKSKVKFSSGTTSLLYK